MAEEFPSAKIEINNIQLPTIVKGYEPIIKRVNINFYSSMLFIFPIIYAYLVLPPYSQVMFGSIACLITSVLHHYYKAENTTLQKIDRITVNSIAAYFILHCIRTIGNKFYANITYFLSAISIGIFYYTNILKPELYSDYHWLVHVFSITGVMFYIKTIKTYLFTPQDTVIVTNTIDDSLSNIT
jgi:hypothetical protein